MIELVEAEVWDLVFSSDGIRSNGPGVSFSTLGVNDFTTLPDDCTSAEQDGHWSVIYSKPGFTCCESKKWTCNIIISDIQKKSVSV